MLKALAFTISPTRSIRSPSSNSLASLVLGAPKVSQTQAQCQNTLHSKHGIIRGKLARRLNHAGIRTQG